MEEIFAKAKNRKFRQYVSKRFENVEDILYATSNECAHYLEELETGVRQIGIPEMINLRTTNHTRHVFKYSKEDKIAMCLLINAIHQYDDKFSTHSYFYKEHGGMHRCITELAKVKDFNDKYILRTDITKFSDSIDADILKEDLKEFFKDDPTFIKFILNFIDDRRYYKDGVLYNDAPAVRQGNAFSVFFDQLYLKDIDFELEKVATYYFRNCDDIVFAVDTKEERDNGLKLLEKLAGERNLKLSEKKTLLLNPGDDFSIFCLKFTNHKITFSKKITDKVNSALKSSRVYVQRVRRLKKLSPDDSIKLFLMIIDKKIAKAVLKYAHFITDMSGLRNVDRAIQNSIRILYTNKLSNSKYRLTHKKMVELGYKSLMNRHYN